MPSSPLWTALLTVKSGARALSFDFDLVDNALTEGADVNEPNDQGQSPLAFLLNHPGCLESEWDSRNWNRRQAVEARLLTMGASIRVASAQGTPLFSEGLKRHFLRWKTTNSSLWLVRERQPDDITRALKQLHPWLDRAKAEQPLDQWAPMAAHVWCEFIQRHGHHDPDGFAPVAQSLAHASLRLLVAKGVAPTLFTPVNPLDHQVFIQPILLAHQRQTLSENVTPTGTRRRLRS